MEKHDFEVKGQGNAKSYADELIEFAAEVDNGEELLSSYSVDHVNVRYGYIVFGRFSYNYNKVFKISLRHGLAVSAVYDPEMHDGEVGLYFKPVDTEMVVHYRKL